LQWRLSPWRLVIGQVALEVDIPALAGNELHGQLALQLGQQQVALQTHLQGAIQPLITQLKLPVPITLAGHLELDIDDYALAAFDGSQDRKSTRLNSSHVKISYAVFCLKK